MAAIDDIKKLLKSKNLVIGTGKTIKKLKLGKLSVVYLSSNCPKNIREDIKYYSGLSGTNVVEIEETNEDIGVACKKPFFISVVSVIK